jgi:hypothetical protein
MAPGERLAAQEGESALADQGPISRVPGDGVRTAALLELGPASRASVEYAQQQLNGLRWKDRSLTAYVPGMNWSG